MRDIVALPIFAALALYAIAHPWIGVMAWTWVSLMSPHRYAWVASQLPIAAVIAAGTLLGIAISRDRRSFYLTPPSTVFILLMIWICVTFPFSLYPDASYEMFTRVMKIDFMILVALVTLHSRKHILVLVGVLVVSVGFYGVKGGLFTLATGGSGRVWGPPGGFLEGNNELGLALSMIIPLLRFLQLHARARWLKIGIPVVMLLSAIGALGTQSRGALLAIAAMSVTMVMRGRNRLVMGVLVVIAGVSLVAFMPDTWTGRMSTISTYQQDNSAMGRINAWGMAYNLACDRFLGSGFENVTPELFQKYAPYQDVKPNGPHSIYFQVLGQHGFVGLFLFLLMWLLVWRMASRVSRKSKLIPEAKWCGDLATMCQVSLVGYLVGGAFLALAHSDLTLNIMVLVILCNRWITNKEWLREETRHAVAVPRRETPLLNSR